MGETLYRRPEILLRWGRLCFDTESPGGISYQSRGDSVSGETLFRDTGYRHRLSVECRKGTAVHVTMHVRNTLNLKGILDFEEIHF